PYLFRMPAEISSSHHNFREQKIPDDGSFLPLFVSSDNHKFHIWDLNMHQCSFHIHYEKDKNQNIPLRIFSAVLQKSPLPYPCWTNHSPEILWQGNNSLWDNGSVLFP